MADKPKGNVPARALTQTTNRLDVLEQRIRTLAASATDANEAARASRDSLGALYDRVDALEKRHRSLAQNTTDAIEASFLSRDALRREMDELSGPTGRIEALEKLAQELERRTGVLQSRDRKLKGRIEENRDFAAALEFDVDQRIGPVERHVADLLEEKGAAPAGWPSKLPELPDDFADRMIEMGEKWVGVLERVERFLEDDETPRDSRAGPTDYLAVLHTVGELTLELDPMHVMQPFLEALLEPGLQPGAVLELWPPTFELLQIHNSAKEAEEDGRNIRADRIWEASQSGRRHLMELFAAKAIGVPGAIVARGPRGEE